LREAKDATDAERKSAESGLTAAKAAAAEVSVNVDEEGATISVDGTNEGQSPLPGPLYLTPGSHTLTAKKDGRDVNVQLNAVAGQTSSTNLRFRKADAAPPPEKGSDESPEKPEASPSTRAEPASPPASEPERRRKPFLEWATTSPIALVGGAVAVVGLGGGIGFAFASRHNYDNADSVASQIRKAVSTDAVDPATTQPFSADPAGICGDSKRQNQTSHPEEYAYACKQYRDNVNSGDTFKTVSTVGWVVAGAAIVGTVVVYFVDGTEPVESASKKPSKRTALVGPWLSGTERGLFVSGSF
jgi:hypothetical protein